MVILLLLLIIAILLLGSSKVMDGIVSIILTIAGVVGLIVSFYFLGATITFFKDHLIIFYSLVAITVVVVSLILFFLRWEKEQEYIIYSGNENTNKLLRYDGIYIERTAGEGVVRIYRLYKDGVVLSGYAGVDISWLGQEHLEKYYPEEFRKQLHDIAGWFYLDKVSKKKYRSKNKKLSFFHYKNKDNVIYFKNNEVRVEKDGLRIFNGFYGSTFSHEFFFVPLKLK